MTLTEVMRSRKLFVGAGFAALLAALAVGTPVLENIAAAQSQPGVMAPSFEVDALWPKPLPNHWVLGSTIEVWGRHGRSRVDYPSQLRDTWRQRATPGTEDR